MLIAKNKALVVKRLWLIERSSLSIEILTFGKNYFENDPMEPPGEVIHSCMTFFLLEKRLLWESSRNRDNNDVSCNGLVTQILFVLGILIFKWTPCCIVKHWNWEEKATMNVGHFGPIRVITAPEEKDPWMALNIVSGQNEVPERSNELEQASQGMFVIRT